MTLTLLAPLIGLAVVALAAAGLRLQRAGQRRLVGRAVGVAAADGLGLPSIIAFTGEHCTICHTAQRPALDALDARLGGRASIREVDVAAEPGLARRYRVLSLPTTIVLRADGTIADVNVGFATVERLERQLVAAGLREGELSAV